MDQDGLFLVLKMCNTCSNNKGSWKKCMSRRHNPRMSTVTFDELTSAHRQCVKPDQSITIYKLRDNETNEEFLEFDERIVFQTASEDCLNIKACLQAGQKLVDWRPTFSGGRVAGNSSDTPQAAKKGGKKPDPARTETPPRSGAAAAGAGVKGSGGVTSKGKVKAEAGSVEKTAHKSSNKRKSPGSKIDPPTKVTKGSSNSRPSSSPPQPSAGTQKPKQNLRRGLRVTRPRPADEDGDSGDELEREPKMKIDTGMSITSNVEDCERMSKRRGRSAPPAAVTPSPKHTTVNLSQTDTRESFSTSDNAMEGNDGERKQTGDRVRPKPSRRAAGCRRRSSVGDAESTVPNVDPPKVSSESPRTVAEKLEVVKAAEAELLKQFKETHERCAQEEAAKRTEMEEFQKAGEEALRVMQAKKEEALRRICEERAKKGVERSKLVQQRLKELEVAEEAARAEAQEKDARLAEEKKRLSCHWNTDAIPSVGKSATTTATATEEGCWTEPDWIMGAVKTETYTVCTASAKAPESGGSVSNEGTSEMSVTVHANEATCTRNGSGNGNGDTRLDGKAHDAALSEKDCVDVECKPATAFSSRVGGDECDGIDKNPGRPPLDPTPGATEGSSGKVDVFQAAALASGAPLNPDSKGEKGVGDAADMETNASCVTAR